MLDRYVSVERFPLRAYRDRFAADDCEFFFPARIVAYIRSGTGKLPRSNLLFPHAGIATERVTLTPVTQSDVAALVSYQLENRAHLAPWEPLWPDSYFSSSATGARVEAARQAAVAGTALSLIIRLHEGELIGRCSFTNIVRGPFQACHLGFSIARRFEGKGLMREALIAATHFMFEHEGLHRIMASFRPENSRSERLLASIGFHREGFARSYLQINGQWADHVLTSMINSADLDGV
jgi:[ribosomal protein S5]-alanine N-acetyltransferase